MRLITSNTSRGAYKAVLDVLKKNISRGGKHIVLVPDRFTASVERGLISALQLQGTFGVQVMSFTRLAERMLGGSIKRCLTPEGSVMLLGKVLSDNADRLQCYRFAAGTDGAANELYAAVTALRNSGISTEQLRDSAKNMPHTYRAKAEDLALIYSEYLAALSDRFSDSSTRLNALKERIAGASYTAEEKESLLADGGEEELIRADYYCIDFYEFKAPELAVLKELNKHALSLTVGMVSGEGNPNARIYPDDTTERLRREMGEGAAAVRCDEQLSESADAISKYLFSYDVPDRRAECGGRVELLRAKDAYEEVLYVALDIITKVMKGARYCDFEIFMSDAEAYSPLIKSVFSRYGIPLFIDGREPLSDQTKVRYILLALDAVRKRMRKEEVLDFVKCPLFSHGAEREDDVFAFENYVLRYNISFSRFEQPFTLGEEDERVRAEKVRILLNNVLRPLYLHNESSFLSISAAVRFFLSAADEAWSAHVERLSVISRYYEKCAEQVDKKLDAVLSEIESVMPDGRGTDAFATVFRSMLETLKISLVPTYLDSVYAGDADSRYLGGGDIYVIGATGGRLPAVSAGGAVISAKDEEMFARCGAEIYPSERRRAYTAMLSVIEVLKKPRGKLTISYPDASPSGTVRPASVIRELTEFLCESGEPLAVRDIRLDALSRDGARGEDMIAAMYSTEKGGMHELLRSALSGRGTETGVYRAAYAELSDVSRDKLDMVFREPERIAVSHEITSISASRLERYFACPYSHYFRYMLSLAKRREGEPEGTENGIVIHYVLECFYRDIMRGEDVGADIDARAEGYFARAVEQEKVRELYAREEYARTFVRLKEECVRLCRDLYAISLRSEFRPAMLEAEIGKDGIRPMSLTVDGRKVALRGKIDRVDVCGEDFVVIDYKTFRSADITLKDVYYGGKIQLHLYMRAIENCGMKPAGVFYFPVYAGFTSEQGGRYRYKGQLIDDQSIIQALDSDWRGGDCILPVKVKDGELKSTGLYSRDMLRKTGDYAVALSEAAVKDISEGYIKPRPAEGACMRCDYAGICAYKNKYSRALDAVDITAFVKEGNHGE